MFEIVAHRGVPTETPENTIPSFLQAVELGADAIEFDVRLTADNIPVVYHYFYLDVITTLPGPIFAYSFEQLQNAQSLDGQDFSIPRLDEVLATVGGKIGLELEMKGPEPHAAAIIAPVLDRYQSLWDTIEVTSYEPMLLKDIKQRCPGLVTDLLFPRSEAWMGLDVVTYTAIQRTRLAGARAVHLHPTQLSVQVVEKIRAAGLEIHAWEVNDEASLQLVSALNIPRLCTDDLRQALEFRTGVIR